MQEKELYAKFEACLTYLLPLDEPELKFGQSGCSDLVDPIIEASYHDLNFNIGIEDRGASLLLTFNRKKEKTVLKLRVSFSPNTSPVTKAARRYFK